MTQLSQDPYTNTGNVYHEMGYEPSAFAVGSYPISTFQVGRFTDGGSTNLGWLTSTGAGQHWKTGLFPGLTLYAGGSHAAISNAVMAYDRAHQVWLISTLAIDTTTDPTGNIIKYGSAIMVKGNSNPSVVRFFVH